MPLHATVGQGRGRHPGDEFREGLFHAILLQLQPGLRFPELRLDLLQGPPLGQAGRAHGARRLVADRAGVVTPFAMIGLQERGTFFVQPTSEVYAGMVVGENSRADDMEVNITKEKKLTNMRASGSDGTVYLAPAYKLDIERAMEIMQADEYIEITPQSTRLRKKQYKG